MKLNIFMALIIAINVISCKNEDKKKEPVATKKDSMAAMLPNDSFATEVDKPVPLTPSAQSVQLRLNLPKGKSYDYEMIFDIKQQAKEREMNNRMKWKYNMEVIDVKDQLKTLQITYKQIEMSMNMGEQKMEFSSEKPASTGFNPLGMISDMFRVIKGKSFTMDVDEKGQIKKVEGFDKLGEAIVKELNVPEASKPAMLAQFKNQFNDESAKEMFSQVFNIFPDKPVKVGDTWEGRSPAMGKGNPVITKYTVQEIKGDKIKLNARSKSEMSQNSTLIVDLKTGLVMDGTISQKMEGEERKLTGKGRIIGKEL